MNWKFHIVERADRFVGGGGDSSSNSTSWRRYYIDQDGQGHERPGLGRDTGSGIHNNEQTSVRKRGTRPARIRLNIRQTRIRHKDQIQGSDRQGSDWQ